MTPFRLKVITPEKVFFDGDTTQVILYTSEGNIGILAKHENYAANLPAGPMKVMIDGEFKVAAIAGGIVKVSQDKTVVIATAVEWADEIDVEWAKRSEQIARERLQSKLSETEFNFARLKLQRALNRLSVSAYKK